MEPTAALPRSFSNNLCPTLHLDGSQDDDVLPFISRMLMEDDVDAVDAILYQQHPDHDPALLQTQHFFAQVLSDDDALAAQPCNSIEEAGRRLTACARQLGVPFRFRGIAAKSEAIRAGDLDIDPDEVLVVSSLFHFRMLTDEGTVATDDSGAGVTDPIGAVLGAIREMKPSVFVHAVVNASYSTAFFATRFREAFYNFTVLFDMMDTIFPRDNGSRLLYERDVLARYAVNVVACEGVDRVSHPRSYKQWQVRSRRAGLRQLPLDRDIVQTIRDKVKREYHEHFVISEDQQWLLQGWKGRVLYAVSTWTADNGLPGTARCLDAPLRSLHQRG